MKINILSILNVMKQTSGVPIVPQICLSSRGSATSALVVEGGGESEYPASM